MPDDDRSGLDRRRFLRSAGIGSAVVWAAPAITTLGSGAYAAGSPPPPTAEVCLKQVFTTDARGSALTFTPGRDRDLNVALNATFSAISSIRVSLYESASDPVDEGETGAVSFRVSPTQAGGVIFVGGGASPITMIFGPTSGGNPPYASLFLDGEGTVIVSQNSGTSFILDKVEVEICGILA